MFFFVSLACKIGPLNALSYQLELSGPCMQSFTRGTRFSPRSFVLRHASLGLHTNNSIEMEISSLFSQRTFSYYPKEIKSHVRLEVETSSHWTIDADCKTQVRVHTHKGRLSTHDGGVPVLSNHRPVWWHWRGFFSPLLWRGPRGEWQCLWLRKSLSPTSPLTLSRSHRNMGALILICSQHSADIIAHWRVYVKDYKKRMKED